VSGTQHTARKLLNLTTLQWHPLYCVASHAGMAIAACLQPIALWLELL
jgi:hypothetical protein